MKKAKVIDFTSSMPEVKLYTPGWHILEAIIDAIRDRKRTTNKTDNATNYAGR